jgi:SPP1 gp7 family putative phage head morphogenesis protein
VELVALLQKSQDDLGAVLSDDAFWFALGEDQKAAFRPTAQAMVRDGMRAADETFGLRAQVGFIAPVDRAIRDTVNTYLDDWWRALESAERTALRDGLNRLAAGKFKGGFQEFRKSMEQSTFGAARGRMIAETETTRLWAMGNELSMERAGVKNYEWRTVQDDRVDSGDPDGVCAQRHGQQFAVGGEGPRPPAHPRCRCAIIPVPDDAPEAVIIDEELMPAPAAEATEAAPSPPSKRRRSEWDEPKQAIGDRFVTNEEYAALVEYKGNPNFVNGPLRGIEGLRRETRVTRFTQQGVRREVMIQGTDEVTANLGSLVGDATLFEDVTLHRGLVLERDTVAKLIDGGTIRDAGFQSFTSDKKIAVEFSRAANHPGTLSDPVSAVLKIDARRSDKILELEDFFPGDLQSEFLFPRGSGFSIRSSSVVNEGKSTEYVEFLVELIS